MKLIKVMIIVLLVILLASCDDGNGVVFGEYGTVMRIEKHTNNVYGDYDYKCLLRTRSKKFFSDVTYYTNTNHQVGDTIRFINKEERKNGQSYIHQIPQK